MYFFEIKRQRTSAISANEYLQDSYKCKAVLQQGKFHFVDFFLFWWEDFFEVLRF